MFDSWKVLRKEKMLRKMILSCLVVLGKIPKKIKYN